MRVWVWLALAALCWQACGRAGGQGQGQGRRRGKRSLLELFLTLWCYRARLATPLLALPRYGCYCGRGGAGRPADAVDECCFAHDCCYRHARVALRCRRRVKWQRYRLSCRGAETQCRSATTCGRRACECDRQLAECLAAARPSRTHFLYHREGRCQGPEPACPRGTEAPRPANASAAPGPA